MGQAPLLLLFVKAPVKGRVKSRLAAELGEEIALQLYRDFVADTITAAERTDLSLRICFHPPEAEGIVIDWLGGDRRYMAQEGQDLGERMEQAFRRAFADGHERVVLIGSDIPDLPSAMLTDAAAALERNDAAIGPARDGGYYLIGFRRKGFLPEIFRGIAWSGPDVFERTMRIFRKAGAAVHTLPPWRDVDRAGDLVELMERNRDGQFSSGRTMGYLGTISAKMRAAEAMHGKI